MRKRIRFLDLLNPLLAAAAAAEKQTRAALAALPAGNSNRPSLAQRIDKLAGELAELRKPLASGTVTLGTCDRLAQALRRSRAGLEELGWTAKLAVLAAEH